MSLGVCYYPEHWPPERWRSDARAMREVGITRVRIGEFAWSVLEPAPGRMTPEWLDEALDVLHDEGLGVILGTPTATPPKWLVDAHPDVLPVGRDGRARGFGSRRHYCFRSSSYARHTERIVRYLAERYGDHPGLVAWQTDNEYGCHDTVRCWCPRCAEAFRGWLRERYGTIDALNDAWWTTFWSQRYRTFDEIDLPEQAVTESNPGQRLDFHRFASDGVIAYNRLQCDAIREHSDRPVLHNSMMLFGQYDHVALAADLDAVAFDNYPLGQLEESPLPEATKARYLRTGHPDLVSLSHDLYRGLKDRPHWVMEQQPGQVNWAASNPLPADGAVRLWTHQAFAHGADTVAWFRWRAALGAQESMHAGLLRHDGRPDAAHREAACVAHERRGREAAATRAEVAILFDYEDLWAAEIQPHARGFAYWSVLLAFYGPLRALGIDVDLVPKRLAGAGAHAGGRSLERYRLVVAPAMTLADEDLGRRLQAYVEGGGHLLLGPRSGTRTPSLGAWPDGSGPVGRLAGAVVTRVDALRPGVTRTLRAVDGRNGLDPDTDLAYGTWADLLEPLDDAGTEVLARYDDPAYRNAAAYVRRPVGRGEVRTLGALLQPEAAIALLEPLLRARDLAPERLPDGVRRSGGTWLNFTADTVPIGEDVVPPFGVRLPATRSRAPREDADPTPR